MTPRLLVACLLTSCALSTALLAAYPPQDPVASLDALLQDAWQKGADKAYALYMGKSRVRMSKAAREAFPKDILEIAQSPNVDRIVVQKPKTEVFATNKLPGPEVFDGAYFVHFLRAGLSGPKIAERIYVNLHPDHATEVMRFVVKELLSVESQHNVLIAKVATPAGLEVRADSMVIYSESLADVDWALERLAEYQKQHLDHFLEDLPAATRPRMKGVSTAAEPEKSLKAESFGSYLDLIIKDAMKQEPKPASFEEFRGRIQARLKADGIDPAHPDRLTRH